MYSATCSGSLGSAGDRISFSPLSESSGLPLRLISSICCIDCLNFDPILNFPALRMDGPAVSSDSDSAFDNLIDGDSHESIESGVWEGGREGG